MCVVDFFMLQLMLIDSHPNIGAMCALTLVSPVTRLWSQRVEIWQRNCNPGVMRPAAYFNLIRSKVTQSHIVHGQTSIAEHRLKYIYISVFADGQYIYIYCHRQSVSLVTNASCCHIIRVSFSTWNCVLCASKSARREYEIVVPCATVRGDVCGIHVMGWAVHIGYSSSTILWAKRSQSG